MAPAANSQDNILVWREHYDELAERTIKVLGSL